MKFDFTGISSETGGVSLEPGRYRVSTQDRWNVTKTDSGNMNLRIPFTVLESGQYEGATSAYYHTIMVPPENYDSLNEKAKAEAAEKLRYNKTLTLQLFMALGLISKEDRESTEDPLHAEFEYGDKDEYDRVPVLSLMVNGERRALDNHIVTAVVITNAYTKSGVKVDRLDPAGKPDTSQATQPDVTPQPQQKSKQGFPF